MKKRIKLLPILFLFIGFVCSKTASATHMLGADITYKETSANVYLITLNLYRDCRGVPMAVPSVILRTPSGQSTAILSTLDSIVDITPTCDTIRLCAPTNTISGAGVERHTFSVTVDLNQAQYADLLAASYFKISISQCCRNSAITTGANNKNFFTEATVYNLPGLNSSPYFYEMPFARLQVNRPFVQNFGGYDVDGDSLVFEMADPLSGPGAVIPYSAGFSNIDPFTTFKPSGVPSPNPNLNPPVGFHLDNSTGIISMTPTQMNEISVLAMTVKEYRNGQLISVSQRDMQFWVEILDNNLAHTVSAPLELCVMAGDSIDFNVVTSDAGDTLFGGSPDSLFIDWVNPFSGPTYSNSSDKFQVGTFGWRPTSSDVRGQAYLLTFSVVDNTCPLRYRVQRTVRIFVKSNQWPSDIIPSFTKTVKGDSLILINTSRNLNQVDSSAWKINGQFVANTTDYRTVLPVDSSYEIVLCTWRLQERGCNEMRRFQTWALDSVTIKSCQASYVIAVDIDTTNPFRIFLVNTSFGTGLSTKWNFSDGDSVVGTGSHNFTKFGKYEVCLEVSNSSCTDTYCDSVGMDSSGNLFKKDGFTIVMLDEDDLKVGVTKPSLSSLNIYPNPFNNQLKIETKDGLQIRSAELTSITGQTIKSTEATDATYLELNTSNLSSGVYYLRLTAKDGSVLNTKLIKR